MPSAYPTNLDSFVAQVDGVDQVDAADVNDLQNAIVAIETFVGKNASADNTSIEYKLKNTSSQDPGHKHTSASIVSVLETQITDGSILARLAAHETVAGHWSFGDYVTVTAGYGQLPSNAAHLVIGAGGVAGNNRVTLLYGDNGAADKLIIGTKNGAAIASIMTLTSNVKSVNFAGDIGSSSALCIRPGDNGSAHTQLSGIVDIMPALGGGTPYITLNGTGGTAVSAKLSIGIGSTTPIAQLHMRGNGPTDPTYDVGGFASGAQLFLEDASDVTGCGGGILFGGSTGKYFAAIKSSLTASTFNSIGDLSISLRRVNGFGTDAGLAEMCRFTSTGRVGFGTYLSAPITQMVIEGDGNSNGGNPDTAFSLPVSLTGWEGCHLHLRNFNNVAGYGGVISFGCGGAIGAAVKYIQATSSGNSRGHLAFSMRGNAGDSTLTEVMRFYSTSTANTVRVGIGTQTPATLFDVSGIAHATQGAFGTSTTPGTALQVDGDFSMLPADVAVTGSQVDNLDPGTGRSVIRITGGTVDFTLTGVRQPALGKLMILINTTGYQMTIAHENVSSTSTRRFYLSELANLQLGGASGNSVAVFVYATTPNGDRWVLMSARSNTAVASTRAK